MKKTICLVFICSLLLSSGQVLAQSLKIPKKSPELLALGKKVFDQNCAICHGPKGDGKGQLGASLKPSPSDFTKPFNQWAFGKGDLKKVFDVVAKGIPNSAMVKWDHLPEQERWALVYFIADFAPTAKKK